MAGSTTGTVTSVPRDDIAAAVAANTAAAKSFVTAAAGFVAVVLAGLQVTQLGGVAPGPWLVAGIGAVVIATVAAGAVVLAATRVLRVPFAQLHEVGALLIDEDDPAQDRLVLDEDLERHEQALRKRIEYMLQEASARGVTTVPELTRALREGQQGMRALGSKELTTFSFRGRDYTLDDIDALSTSLHAYTELARAVVAVANRYVHARRFDALLEVSVSAAASIVVAVVLFVAATTFGRPPAEPTVTEPVAVTVTVPGEPCGPRFEGRCGTTFAGWATAGSWPYPTVVLPDLELVLGGRAVADHGLIVVPSVAPDSHDAPASG